jgi:hypothetical protein
MMQTHPAIAAALADQHCRAMIAEAESARLARAAHCSRAARAARADCDSSARRAARQLVPHRHCGISPARRGLARLLPARAR